MAAKQQPYGPFSNLALAHLPSQLFNRNQLPCSCSVSNPASHPAVSMATARAFTGSERRLPRPRQGNTNIAADRLRVMKWVLGSEKKRTYWRSVVTYQMTACVYRCFCPRSSCFARFSSSRFQNFGAVAVLLHLGQMQGSAGSDAVTGSVRVGRAAPESVAR